MAAKKIDRVLISVWDKEGLPELLKGLADYGAHFISTGGSAKEISRLGYSCQTVESLTASPEMFEGRVKTLHPKIFGAILGRGNTDTSEQQKHGITPFDMVVVNLYPFADGLAKPGTTHQALLELIDVGGVSLIRAAAKNHEHCVVVSGVEDYAGLLSELKKNQGTVGLGYRRQLAAKALSVTAHYDNTIAAYLRQGEGSSDFTPPQLAFQQNLVYGENPHQRAALFGVPGELALFQTLGGKPLSYNNLLDLEACVGTLTDLPNGACVIVKHANPCGVGVREKDPLAAYELALSGDPVSAFGGILGFHQPVDLALAERINQKFYEIIVAPQFSPEALTHLQGKPKMRIIQCDLERLRQHPTKLWRQTLLGALVQDRDLGTLALSAAKVVSRVQPTSKELQACELAWRVCKWVKSNAIVLANGEQTVGIGAGQMSRVDSVGLALKKAVLPLTDCALASDAFFPFRDNIDLAHQSGVRLLVQPGGSMRDPEVIAAADEHGMVMLFTGQRHFRH